MEREGLACFSQEVARDESLQQALTATSERQAFIVCLIRCAAERGYCFTEEDVEAALRSAHQSWLLRWLEE